MFYSCSVIKTSTTTKRYRNQYSNIQYDCPVGTPSKNKNLKIRHKVRKQQFAKTKHGKNTGKIRKFSPVEYIAGIKKEIHRTGHDYSATLNGPPVLSASIQNTDSSSGRIEPFKYERNSPIYSALEPTTKTTYPVQSIGEKRNQDKQEKIYIKLQKQSERKEIKSITRGEKSAKKSLIFGIIGLSLFLVYAPFFYFPISALLLLPIFILGLKAIHQGSKAKFLLHRAKDSKAWKQANTGKILGIITVSFIGITIALIIAFFVMLFIGIVNS